METKLTIIRYKIALIPQYLKMMKSVKKMKRKLIASSLLSLALEENINGLNA